jgi:two-component system, NarL family, nitrate/nitrite response regulator NarL
MHILLADDHPLFAEALKELVRRSIPDSRLESVGTLEDAHRALAGPDTFDLLVLDLDMPGMNGLDGLDRTRSRYPELPIAIVSGVAEPDSVRKAIARGAKGFLPKTMPSAALSAALQVIAAGGTYVPSDYAAPAGDMAAEQVRGPGGMLTPREREILGHLVSGMTNKEIARALALQEITVKLHVRSIFRKLGVRNRVEAVNAAARLALVSPAGR